MTTTNPPAFPAPMNYVCRGMDLRDWFAGQVLTMMRPSTRVDLREDSGSIASTAYIVADAMLKAREKV